MAPDDPTLGDLPPLTYLAMDALDEGVGASQVLAYVERLAARGVDVRLHTFEKRQPAPALRQRLDAARVRWTPHPFGRYGPVGGVQRTLAGALAVRGAALVHARSDLAAASVMLARRRRWVWDARALFPDQRVALGTLRPRSPEDRMLRAIERSAAGRSSAIITLTHAAAAELARRYGPGVGGKATVITTCVDTTRFALVDPPPSRPARFLLAGTLNRFYDVPAMLALVEAARTRYETELVVATQDGSSWDEQLEKVPHRRVTAAPADMPELVAAVHVGLSVCRENAGVSLRAAMPTKIGEFLATGRPVVVNPGLGDAGTMLPAAGCGVALASAAADDVARALDELDALLADPATGDRCRALARSHFDLDRAVDSLVEVYRRVA